ncbi:MAG: AI-2E family transporter, partial [Hyphomicrobium sp.]
MPLISESLRNLSAALMVGAILIAALVLGKDVLIPLTLAMVLAFILSPVVGWIAKMRVPRALAVAFVMLLLIAAVAGFTAVVSAQLISLTAGIGSYRANVIEKVRAVTGRSGGQSDLAKAAEEVGSLGAAIRKEIAVEPAVPADTLPSTSTPEVPSGKTIIVSKENDQTDSGYGDYLATAVTPFAKAALTLLLTLF